ncbi:hypothetical protein Hanom_Chr09g00794751 [Helianthus anomalus]
MTTHDLNHSLNLCYYRSQFKTPHLSHKPNLSLPPSLSLFRRSCRRKAKYAGTRIVAGDNRNSCRRRLIRLVLGKTPPFIRFLNFYSCVILQGIANATTVLYVIGWELRASLGNLASSRCLKSVEQFSLLIRLWILYLPL